MGERVGSPRHRIRPGDRCCCRAAARLGRPVTSIGHHEHAVDAERGAERNTDAERERITVTGGITNAATEGRTGRGCRSRRSIGMVDERWHVLGARIAEAERVAIRGTASDLESGTDTDRNRGSRGDGGS